jgi:hypothetical protein
MLNTELVNLLDTKTVASSSEIVTWPVSWFEATRKLGTSLSAGLLYAPPIVCVCAVVV